MEKAPKQLEVITRYFTDFSDHQLEQFALLDNLYKEWNEKINVISRKDISSLYEKHILHSLAIAAIFRFTAATEVIDIGTGGGFPGIPLAIFFPETRFHLTDSIGKKLKVVNEVIAGLDLKNVTTEHIRAEDIKNRKFDFAVSRAVAPATTLLQWSMPLLREGKKTESYGNGLICLKGGDLQNEIRDTHRTPLIWEIATIFSKETFFEEKYILYFPK